MDPLNGWRAKGRARAPPDESRGAAGVHGGDWDIVCVVADNAKLPRDEYAEVLKFVIVPGHSGSESDRVLNVPRSLAGVRQITIDPFVWPTLPSLPAMKTNSAQVSVLVEELDGRAVRLGSELAHFWGELDMTAPAAFLYYQATSITDALSRSIGATTRWHRDNIVFQPPVSLDRLSLLVLRGERRLSWPPYRVTVSLQTPGGLLLDMTMANGSAHNLEAGMEIIFEETPANGATKIPEIEKNTKLTVASVVSSTQVRLSTPTAYAIVGGTVSGGAVIPARRLLIGFAFEVARTSE